MAVDLMSMNPVKPAEFFARAEHARRLIQFLRYGGGGQPQPPGRIADWDAITAVVPGRIIIDIRAMPDGGDSAYRGDGRGVILDTEWDWGDGGMSLGSTLPAIHTVSVPEDQLGATLPIRVRAIGTAGAGLWSVPIVLTIPDPAEEAQFVFAIGVYQPGVFA